MKKTLSLILLISLIALMSACGKTPDTAQSADANGAAATSTSTTADATDKPPFSSGSDSKESKGGFFSRLFSFGDSDKAKEAQRYRVTVKGAENGNSSSVTVQDNTGKPDTSVTATKILSLLHGELK